MSATLTSALKPNHGYNIDTNRITRVAYFAEGGVGVGCYHSTPLDLKLEHEIWIMYYFWHFFQFLRHRLWTTRVGCKLKPDSESSLNSLSISMFSKDRIPVLSHAIICQSQIRKQVSIAMYFLFFYSYFSCQPHYFSIYRGSLVFDSYRSWKWPL